MESIQQFTDVLRICKAKELTKSECRKFPLGLNTESAGPIKTGYQQSSVSPAIYCALPFPGSRILCYPAASLSFDRVHNQGLVDGGAFRKPHPRKLFLVGIAWIPDERDRLNTGKADRKCRGDDLLFHVEHCRTGKRVAY